MFVVHNRRIRYEIIGECYHLRNIRCNRRIAERNEQHLEGSDSLLAIDDIVGGMCDTVRGKLSQDNGTQKMLARCPTRRKFINFLEHILPQWLPLITLIPNVLSLKYRDDVPTLRSKELSNIDLLWKHERGFLFCKLRLVMSMWLSPARRCASDT
jgi:hypothetical protein